MKKTENSSLAEKKGRKNKEMPGRRNVLLETTAALVVQFWEKVTMRFSDACV